MLQLVLYGLLAIVVAGVLFLLATRFLPAGEQIAPPLRDEPPWDLPTNRMLASTDIDGMRLPVALRGYRFAETDLLLDRLAGEIRLRDQEITRLRQYVSAPVPQGSDRGEPRDSETTDAVRDSGPEPAPLPASEPASEPGPADDAPVDDRPAEEDIVDEDVVDDHAAYRPGGDGRG